MSTLEDWIAEVKQELGLDLVVDTAELLDLTKVVAHSVARPAAPLTAFLVGYAAAQAGGGADEVRAAGERVTALAEAHAGDDPA